LRPRWAARCAWAGDVVVLPPPPGGARIAALRKSLAQAGVLAPDIAAFFADPVVNGIVQAAKLRALEE
jgi:hypothetical protein